VAVFSPVRMMRGTQVLKELKAGGLKSEG